MRTPWALPLECPFSYLHVRAAKVVAENGRPLPGHLLSRLSQYSPSVRYPAQMCWSWDEAGWEGLGAGSGSGPSVVQEEIQTWYLGSAGEEQNLEHV